MTTANSPPRSRSTLTRRAFIGGSAISLAALGTYSWFYNHRVAFAGNAIDPPTALRLAGNDEITLIDIRTPREWEKTGVGESANPIDMRREDFVAALDALVGNDRSKPVALICARGVRSARLSNALTQAGYTNIIDVPEGMLGSDAGPGWLKRGLPVVTQ
jgi:rhodanese-related sulfurtransferase